MPKKVLIVIKTFVKDTHKITGISDYSKALERSITPLNVTINLLQSKMKKMDLHY